MATLYAGTSGFAYPAWKPGFYPAKTPANQFLKYYAQRLNCVEINYTFRRLPSASTLENWVAQTPPVFVFAVKANMRITHILRLKNAAEATGLFLKMIDPLRSARRLGPILFQLPPAMKCDVALLRSYLELLPRDLLYALRVSPRELAGRRSVRCASRAQRVAMRSGIGETGSSARNHCRLRLLPPSQARLHGRRRGRHCHASQGN